MASATLSTTVPIIRESWGSMQLHIMPFSDVDDTNIYASGISGNIVGYWANCTDDATAQTKNAIDVALSGNTFTFSVGENNREAMLYVLSKGTG